MRRQQPPRHLPIRLLPREWPLLYKTHSLSTRPDSRQVKRAKWWDSGANRNGDTVNELWKCFANVQSHRAPVCAFEFLAADSRGERPASSLVTDERRTRIRTHRLRGRTSRSIDRAADGRNVTLNTGATWSVSWSRAPSSGRRSSALAAAHAHD